MPSKKSGTYQITPSKKNAVRLELLVDRTLLSATVHIKIALQEYLDKLIPEVD